MRNILQNDNKNVITRNKMYSSIIAVIRYKIKLIYYLHKRSVNNKNGKIRRNNWGKYIQFLVWFSISQIVLCIYSPLGKLKQSEGQCGMKTVKCRL